MHHMVFNRAFFALMLLCKTHMCVTSTKSFRVIIDNRLRWNDHLTLYKKNIISKLLGIHCKIRQQLDTTILTNMYYLFVFPYLT